MAYVRAADGQRLALSEISDPSAERRGDAAFLLVHGFAQDRRGFTLGPMPGALLRRGARVFLGELRGHGDSRVSRSLRWDLRTHLELDCPALLDGVRARSGAERVHWVGHSMGGLLGCALLEHQATALASLTAIAAPILLGADRPEVRLASALVGPIAALAPRSQRVPMNHLLGVLAAPLSRCDAPGPIRLLQRATRLVNPRGASPEAVAAILSGAHPESPAVLRELAANAVLGRARIAGVDLVAALRGSPLPVAAVVGSRDVFAPPATVASLRSEGHAGPRRILELPDVSHVDAIMGHHVPQTIDSLWDFLLA
jgi:pimeloyl-ACP methyl ester carboxylesterase